MTFREFTDNVKGAATMQVSLIEGERDIAPLLYLCDGEHVEGVHADAAWFAAEDRTLLVQSLVLPYVEIMRPRFVAWTFTGRRGNEDGEWEHETAVAICIEREVHETWLARLVRHDNTASLGAWRSWPANQQEGRMLTPIQEALR